MNIRELSMHTRSIATILLLVFVLTNLTAVAQQSYLPNNVQMTVSGTPGVGSTINLGSATTGHQSAASASVPNGAQVSYYVLDVNNTWEQGHATYNSSGPSLTSRTPISSSSSGSAISMTSAAIISFVIIGTDFNVVAGDLPIGEGAGYLLGDSGINILSNPANEFLATPASGIGNVGLRAITCADLPNGGCQKLRYWYYTSGSGNFTPSVSTLYKIEICGPGGSGATSSTSGTSSGGGGAGGCATDFENLVASTNYAYSIGSPTTFTGINSLSCSAGSNGSAANSSQSTGGAAGTCTGGAIIQYAGSSPGAATTGGSVGGNGGSSPFGSGGASSTSVGNNGNGCGSGGSGSHSTGSSESGGTGASGCILIEAVY